MKREDIIHRLDQFNCDPSEYWLVTGAAMVIYGMKDETSDIDMGCTAKMADQLERDGHEAIRLDDGTRRFRVDHDIEIFENWLFDRVELVAGIPVISIQGLIEMKRSLGREKDKVDLERIEQYLQKNGRAMSEN